MAEETDFGRTDRPWTAQPPPIPNGEISVHHTAAARVRSLYPEVAEDLLDRGEFGFRKYKTRLQPNNGRKARWDLYEELLDAVAYAEQGFREGDLELRPVLGALFQLADTVRPPRSAPEDGAAHAHGEHPPG